jgi:uncharacterized integral membrane protein
MSKFKGLWLLVIGALLAIFLVENWHYPDPPIQFLGFRFLPLPHALVMLSCFILGFLGGYLAHAFRVRKQKHEVIPEPPQKD